MPTIDDYATPLKLPMTIDTFARFPRVPGYRSELQGGNLVLTHAPRLSMARLRVWARQPRMIDGISICPLDVRTSQEPLAKLFTEAFAHLAPLDTMAPTTRRHAADAEMKHVVAAGHGPLMDRSCFGAFDARGKPIGAAIVTRLSLRSDEWPEVEMPPILPNLTWLFVIPDKQRRGIGTVLLDHVISSLAAETLPWLVSHLAIDNLTSTMFHWRSGFELVSRVAKPYDEAKPLTKA